MAALCVEPPAPPGVQYSPFGMSREAQPERFDVFDGEVIVADLATASKAPREGQEAFPGERKLQELLAHPRPVGFDMEWRPDRKGWSNPVALVQLATEDWALLLRTHRSRRWLPKVVVDVLTSEAVRKAVVGFDGADRQKLQNSFGLEAAGIADVATVAMRKGLEKTGLKSLAKHFGLNIRKDACTACSDWECVQLSERQCLYAAEDAYFSLWLLSTIEQLPDAAPADPATASAAPAPQSAAPIIVPQLQANWAQRGVSRRTDGLWCERCGKGPIFTLEVMERHLDSKQHQRKESAGGPGGGDPETAVEVPEILLARGIRYAQEGPRSGQLVCALCSAGPFANFEAVRGHLRGRIHLRKEAARAPLEPTPEMAEAGIVLGEDDSDIYLSCSVCESGRFVDIETAQRHIEGRVHRRKVQERDAKEGATDDPPPKRGPPAPTEEDLAGLPGYVQIGEEDQVVCALCNVRAISLRNLFQHLDSERHAKVCRRWGEREIVYVPERERFEELRSGRPVRRTAWTNRAALEHPTPEIGGAVPSSSSWDAGRRDWSTAQTPAAAWLQGAAKEEEAEEEEEASQGMAEETSAASGRRRLVRFADDDTAEDSAQEVEQQKQRCRGSAWLDGGQGDRVLAEESASCASDGAAAMSVRALRDVLGQPGAEGDEDSGFLALAVGDLVVVEAQDPTGALYWGRAVGGERRGWLSALDVEVVSAEADGGPSGASAGPREGGGGRGPEPCGRKGAPGALRPGSRVIARCAVVGPSGDWAATNFLVFRAGDCLRVLHVEDGWMWAEMESGSEGWAPVSAVEIPVR